MSYRGDRGRGRGRCRSHPRFRDGRRFHHHDRDRCRPEQSGSCAARQHLGNWCRSCTARPAAGDIVQPDFLSLLEGRVLERDRVTNRLASLTVVELDMLGQEVVHFVHRHKILSGSELQPKLLGSNPRTPLAVILFLLNATK